MAARQNSTPKAHDEAPSPERQVVAPDYPKNSKSWLSMLPSLRGNGGHGPHPNLPEVPWRTLCMDMPHGSQFDPEAYGSRVLVEFAGRFRIFMLLVVLSEVDGLILQHVNMLVSTEDTTTFCSTPHDPMSAEIGLVLENMEAITSHDGGSCCLPPRQDSPLLARLQVLAGSKRELYCLGRMSFTYPPAWGRARVVEH
ncbi:Ankyrin and HET domain protein, partial [Metarhizium hybridum]